MEQQGFMIVDAVAILKAGMPWTLIPMHKCSGPGWHVPKVVDYALEHGATCIICGLLLPMYHLATTYLPWVHGRPMHRPYRVVVYILGCWCTMMSTLLSRFN